MANKPAVDIQCAFTSDLLIPKQIFGWNSIITQLTCAFW